MINNELNNLSEQLSAFLDGELETSESEVLFYEIASKPELQEQLKGFVNLKNAFHNSQMVPPDHLKNAILGRIGLDDASIGALPAATVSFYSKMLGSRTVISLASATVAVVATFLLLSSYFNNKIEDMNKSVTTSKSIKSNNIPVVSSLADKPDSKFIPNDKQAKPRFFNSSINPIEETRNDAVLISQNSESNSNPSITSDETIEDNNLETIDNNRIINILSSNYGIISPNSNLNLKNKKSTKIFSDNSNFGAFIKRLSMQIRTAQAKSYPDVDVAPLSEPIINNFGLALLYDLDSKQAIGIEIGQENFLQKFEGNENGIPVTWNQNYLAFWSGVTYQFRFKDLFVLDPYVKVLAGGTKIGPIAKLTAGLRYDLSEKFATFVGCENTGLLYSFQGKYFTSYKLGITGGISLKF